VLLCSIDLVVDLVPYSCRGQFSSDIFVFSVSALVLRAGDFLIPCCRTRSPRSIAARTTSPWICAPAGLDFPELLVSFLRCEQEHPCQQVSVHVFLRARFFGSARPGVCFFVFQEFFCSSRQQFFWPPV
jgi:hypothetical protein